MKKICYDAGPDEITVGWPPKERKLKRGVAEEFDDKTADALLRKPMFREEETKPTRGRGDAGTK